MARGHRRVRLYRAPHDVRADPADQLRVSSTHISLDPDEPRRFRGGHRNQTRAHAEAARAFFYIDIAVVCINGRRELSKRRRAFNAAGYVSGQTPGLTARTMRRVLRNTACKS